MSYPHICVISTQSLDSDCKHGLNRSLLIITDALSTLVELQVAALALDPSQEPVAGDDAEDAVWMDVSEVSHLKGEE